MDLAEKLDETGPVQQDEKRRISKTFSAGGMPPTPKGDGKDPSVYMITSDARNHLRKSSTAAGRPESEREQPQ